MSGRRSVQLRDSSLVPLSLSQAIVQQQTQCLGLQHEIGTVSQICNESDASHVDSESQSLPDSAWQDLRLEAQHDR